jgi:hypothetical protein
MLRGTRWVQQNPTSTATREAEVVLSGENVENAGEDVAAGLSARAFAQTIASAQANDIRAMIHFSEIGQRVRHEMWHHPSWLSHSDALLESLTDDYLGANWGLKPPQSSDLPLLSYADSARKMTETLLARDPSKALHRSELLATAAHHYREEQEEIASKEIMKAAFAVALHFATELLMEWVHDLTGIDTPESPSLLATDGCNRGDAMTIGQLREEMPGRMCSLTQAIKHRREQKHCNEHRDIERTGRRLLKPEHPAANSPT